MRRILTAVLVSLVSITVLALPPEARGPRPEAGKHFILTPARLLNEQEQADLASRGLTIVRPLTGGRFLVRLANDATVATDDPRIASLVPVTAERKLDRSAVRELARGRAGATLDVLFYDEVSFADAKAAVASAGGSMVEPLQTGFHVPRRISIHIAPSAALKLAADERVMLVFGPRHLVPITDNSNEAALSHVTPLYSPPYSLSGQGVVLSYFELAEADSTHPEFQGRLTTHVTGGSSGDKEHATHTGGTMIAAGLDPLAKGMAPAATLQEFDASASNWLDAKQTLVSTYSSVADNNSWGFILGWCGPGENCSDWTWYGAEVYLGGYSAIEAGTLDDITRKTGVMMVHSAGNHATSTGPSLTPFLHTHVDNNNNKVSGYCYSPSGNGNDCPAPTCKSGTDTNGDPFCETTKHPEMSGVLPGPWISVGVTASAKNVMTVGAVSDLKTIASFSSRGPTRDGRVKPDIVARGTNVYSTEPGLCGGAGCYGVLNGTSMAAPVVTGSSALLVEQWKRTFGGATPSAAALKTLMLATAEDLGNPGPDYTYGFGLLNAQAAVDMIVADAGQARRIAPNTIQTGQEIDFALTINTPQNLRVVLGWVDPETINFPIDSGDPTDPIASKTLVNDLDLSVVDPRGNPVLPYVLDPTNPSANATHGVNTVDNTEEVEIPNATPGQYKIVVRGTAVVASSPQPFVLVSNADLSAPIVPCTQPLGDISSTATAYGNLVATQTIRNRTCTASDVAYFKFLVDKPGPVSVTVTASDTPLKVTLSSSATADVVATVAPGTTQTISTNYSGTAPVTFFVRVEPAGTIGTSARYTITPNFSTAQHARRRSAGRH